MSAPAALSRAWPVNEAIARARRQHRYRPLETDTGPVETVMPQSAMPDPEQETMTRELGGLIEGAVDRLADGYREVFVLREIEGMSTADTADALQVSPDVVKTRLSRARAMLRRDLFERAGLAADNVFPFLQPRCDRVVAAVLARISA